MGPLSRRGQLGSSQAGQGEGKSLEPPCATARWGSCPQGRSQLCLGWGAELLRAIYPLHMSLGIGRGAQRLSGTPLPAQRVDTL